MKERNYFLLIHAHELVGRVDVSEPNGDIGKVGVLVEGVHDIDFEEVLRGEGRVVVESQAHTIITGRALDLADLLAWAIERGYLEERRKRGMWGEDDLP